MNDDFDNSRADKDILAKLTAEDTDPHADCTEGECKAVKRSTIEEVLAADENGRLDFVIATTVTYLEKLGNNLINLKIIDPEDARVMTVLTLKRGLAILENRDEDARAIEAEGKEIQKPINAKAKERYEQEHLPKLAQQERELRELLASLGLTKSEVSH